MPSIPLHTDNSEHCPLCTSADCHVILRLPTRDYLRCVCCDLVFVPARFQLSRDEEKAIYDCHQNHPDDQGYRGFLNRLMEPLKGYLKTGAQGLDFGSGPGPTLSLMLQEAGHPCAIYDPFYAPDKKVLGKHYDFVTSTEVVEHLSQPGQVFETLFSLLKPQGVLGVMTKFQPLPSEFERWHYIKDPTHITFYSRDTLAFIAQKFNRTLKTLGKDVAIFLPATPA